MGGIISDDIKERIREAADIVEVVREYVPLKKTGRNYFGLCPFHDEDSPSFSVSAEKQIFYCFGCQAGGDVFRFLMLKENLSFPEAVGRLADHTGITLPKEEKDPRQQRAEQQRNRGMEANQLAAKYYNFLLTKEAGFSGREYLQKRGLSPEIIEQFQIGFAPASWDSLLRFMESRGYHTGELAELGLLSAHTRENKQINYYDQFRNRVMFPIWNHYNKVIGFGGRVLDNSLPKYLNSPDSRLFNKGKILYGLNFALNAVRDQDQIIVMEGYLDVITAHQFGISNAVAALGTAMTEDHARLIKRYTNNVILALDADQAGIKAALRGLDILQAAGLHVKVAPVPDGKDPDEYIRRFGALAFSKLLTDKARSLVQFKMAQAAGKYDLTTITGKTSALAEVLPNLDRVRSDVEREEYLHILGQELNLSWDTIMSELRKYRKNQNNLKVPRDKIVKNRNNNIGHANSVQPVPQAKPDGRQKAELTLLRLALENKGNLQYVEDNLGTKGFREASLNTIMTACREQITAKGDCYPPDLYAHLAEAEASILSRVLMLEVPLGNIKETMEGCLKTIHGAEAGDRKGQLLKELTEAEKVGDWQLVAQLMTEYKELFN